MNHPSQPIHRGKGGRPSHRERRTESKGEREGTEMKGAANADIPQEIIVTPPIEDEAYTLEAFGDISLSNIDFLTLKLPADDRASISGTYKRRSGYTHKIKAPSLSKARVDATEMSFESLVANYKHSREAPSTPASQSRAAGSRRAAVSEAVMQGSQPPLADLKNLGGGAAISAGGSHDVVENNGYTKALVGSAVKCAAGRGENGAGAPGVAVALPKRPPLPRWDDDKSWQSAAGAVVARYKLA
ncbi:hypothetical protein BJ912DRAFT_1142610 [Pholiota molesta]|nr:hypothetical protein BJ912DRAFT_1142610 [Pholiota molesta]